MEGEEVSLRTEEGWIRVGIGVVYEDGEAGIITEHKEYYTVQLKEFKEKDGIRWEGMLENNMPEGEEGNTTNRNEHTHQNRERENDEEEKMNHIADIPRKKAEKGRG